MPIRRSIRRSTRWSPPRSPITATTWRRRSIAARPSRTRRQRCGRWTRSWPPRLPADTPAETLQTLVYDIGKRPEFGFAQLRDWFRALYETLLGSSQGPRMGSFIALYGIAGTRRLIAEALERR